MKEKKEQPKRLKIAVVIVFLFFTIPISPQNRPFRFDHISLNEGLSQNTVFCMLQDSKGFIWFCTQDGLNKYDGCTFTVYKPEPGNPTSLSHNIISSICEDSSGMFWIGTSNGGVNRFDPVEERFYHYPVDPDDPNCINSRSINVIYQDRAGTIWIGTGGGGLSKLTRQKDLKKPAAGNEKIVTYRMSRSDPGCLSSDYVSSILEDRSGILWVGTGEGLDKFDRKTGNFTHYRHNADDPFSLSHSLVTALFEDRSGLLWVGTDRGLNSLDKDSGKFTRYLNRPADSGSLSSNLVKSIIDDSSGALWVGTINGGLNRLDKKTGIFTHCRHECNDPESLSLDDISCLYKDHSDILWIGTYGKGVNKFDRQNNFKHYQEKSDNLHSLSSNFIYSIYEDLDGVLWIATGDRGLNKLDRKTGYITHYRHIPGKPNSLGTDRLRYIYEDGAGTLWIGSFEAGLEKFNRETETFTHYRRVPNDPSSLSHDSVYSIHEDSSGILWVGTFGGGLNKFNPATETFTRFQRIDNDPDSLNSNLIDVIYEAPSEPGILLIGTRDRGINRFDTSRGTFTHWTAAPDDPYSLSSDKIDCIYEDSAGTLWVATYGGGLNKAIYRQGERVRFVHYTEKHGLSNDSVYGILEDSSGNLWMSTNRGISKFDPIKETFKSYDARDGLQANEFNAGAYYKSRNGEMFFGGINGFNAFYPDEIKDNPHIPPIAVTGFRIANKPVGIGRDSPLKQFITYAERIVLPYDKNIISFEFAALDFTVPGKNRYAYKMEGLDEDWLYTDAGQRLATYTYLAPGEYVFRVKGSNNDGLWNEHGTSLQVVILPPFYLTWWFKAITILGLAAIIYALCKMRIKAVSIRLKKEIAFRELLLKHDISKREKEIIDMILEGKSNKDIEDELFISYHTVKNHLYSIYKKFKVRSRGELVLIIGTYTRSLHAAPHSPLPVMPAESSIKKETPSPRSNFAARFD